MRTSKKLLSLFLAVVMVITSCSVGFTAFAADGNQTDKNLTYWNDKTTAKDAIDAIEDLIVAVLTDDSIKINDKSIKQTLEDAGINVKTDCTSKETLQGVVKDASPLLLNLIGGSKSKQDWLKDTYGGSYAGANAALYDKAFEIVDGDGDDAFSFYWLYNFCKENKNNPDASSGLKDYCEDTLKILDKLKEKAEARYNKFSKSDSALKNLDADIYVANPDGTDGTAANRKLSNAVIDRASTLAMVRTAKYKGSLKGKDGRDLNGVMLKDITLDDVKAMLGDNDYYVDYYQNVFDKIGLANEVKSLAELMFYHKMTNGKTAFQAFVMIYLLNKAGENVSADGVTGITVANVRQKISEHYDGQAFYNKYSPNPTGAVVYGMNGAFTPPAALNVYAIDANIGDDSGSEGKYEYSYAPVAVLNCWLADRGNKITTYRATNKTNSYALEDLYKPIVDQLAIEGKWATADDISGSYVTDEQIQAAITKAGAEDWGSADLAALTAFLKSPDNKFSPAVTAYLNTLIGRSNTTYLKGFQEQFNPNSSHAGAGTVQGIRDFVIQGDGATYFTDLTFENRTKAMASSELILAALGENKANRFKNTDADAIDIVNLFAEEVCNKEENVKNIYDYEAKYNSDGEQTADGKSIVVPNDYAVEIVNSILNGYIAYVDNDSLKPVVKLLLGDGIDLGAALKNVWLNLYEDPVATVFNILPTLVSVIDGLVPILFHDDNNDVTAIESGLNATPEFILMSPPGTLGAIATLLESLSVAFGADLTGLADTLNLYKYSQAAGEASGVIDDQTKIGLGAIHIDLNIALPAIFHYLNGDMAGAAALIASNPATPNPTYNAPYNTQVLRFTNIYLVDGIVMQSQGLAGLIETIGAVAGSEIKLSDTVKEMLTELTKDLMNAVDAAKDTSEKRYINGDGIERQDGLNNLMVSLPKLINALGQNFMTEHHVDSDWAFTYSAASGASTQKIDTRADIGTYNTHVQGFKDLAPATYSDMTRSNAADVLEQFVDLLIGNWINALLDFLNDATAKDDNDITKEVPLVQGLIEAIGGFGQKSVLSDALNGLFQLKRSDKASFTLEKRDKTGFVGLSNVSALFLISNVRYNKAGEDRGLWPFIAGIVNGNKKANYSYKKAFSGVPLLAASSKNKSAAGTDYNKLLTKDNLKAAQKLVDVLDEVLSSLFENTSLNGYDWTSNENFLSSAVTFAAAYFGEQNTNDIVKLLNNYLYFVVGETKKNPSKDGKIGTQPKGGNVDKDKIYTSANLSNLVIQTYSLLENIIDYLFYNSQTGVLNSKDPNMLIADALYGIVSPDAVGIRLSGDYADTAKILAKKDFLNWNSFKVDVTAVNNEKKEYITKDYLKFGFSKGDKTAFYDALGESLNGVAAVLGALLTKSYVDEARSGNLYSEVLYPLLSSLADATGAKGVMSVDAFNKATAPQQLIKGIITPLSGILSQLWPAPISFILNLVKGLGNVLKDSNISKIVKGVFGTVNLHIDGICNLLDKKVTNLSPTLAAQLRQTLSGKLDMKLPDKNIAVAILNKLLAKRLGFSLPNINWDKLAGASSPAEVLLLVYGYVVDTLLGSDLLTSLIDSLDPSISKVLKKLSAAQILDVLAQIIKVVQSPTEVYWTFSMYAAKLTNSFVYPRGINAKKADEAVVKLDQLVENVFPLLNGLGVTDIEGLESLINDKLYTNENITAICKALYGAMTGNSTVAAVLKALNMDVTPQGMAKYLTDKSYGKTYSSAAKTLKKAKSWDKVKKLNWGYKNGSSNAEKGFINGLAAALRPLNKILAVFLCEGKLDLSKLQIKNAIKALTLKGSTVLKADKPEYNCNLTYKLEKGMLTLTFQSNVKTINNRKNNKNVLKIDVDAIAGDIENLLKDTKLNFGTNGYENAIVPLLEAFMCKNLRTYKQYKADYKKAKDNLLINILKPIAGLLKKLANKPFDTLMGILPNFAYFLDSNGLAQAVANLLSPIFSKKGIIGVLAKNGLDIDKLVKSITGKSLGKVIAELIGYNGKLTVSLTDLKKTNIQDIIVPLLNNLVLNKWNIKLPTIDWGKLASHGKIKVVKSAARNSKGKFTTRQVIARKGETLIAVLRYIADTLIKNAKAIKKLLVGIDAIKNNDTIKSVVESILDQISTAKKDDIVLALLYLLVGEPTDKFFDYRGFEYKDYEFDWGELDEDFCRKLAPMLDGLIGGLLDGGLAGLVNDKLYTDELIGKLATGLYGAIEGVKISDDLGNLTDLLAMTDIDMSTTGVAALLTNKDYGKSYPDVARKIRNASSWKSIKAEDLKFGVKDRDSFMHALVAVLRPLYGVLDVLLNDSALNLFNLVSIPGSDDYSSTIVPLLEAFGVYNIKTQYQYREDIFEEYDAILLDIINPLWDKVEDVLNAPIETLGNILPNLALFFANGGLTQVLDNLLTPITALLDALRPIVDINELLGALGLDVPKLLKDKVGLTVTKFDLYDLQGTLNPLIGADHVVDTLNAILKIIKIKGKPLGLELPDINWFKLASCGEYNLNATSQAATLGSRISVKPDEDQAFITVLRFLIETINYKDNYDKILNLVTGLVGDNETVAGVLDQVFGLLQGDTDQVIKDLVDLLQQLAG